MKVHVRTTCSFCEGEAYLPVREAASCTGERFTQHRRCAYCLGSGEQENWVTLREFAVFLERTTSMSISTAPIPALEILLSLTYS
jgi:hypothetical protein